MCWTREDALLRLQLAQRDGTPLEAADRGLSPDEVRAKYQALELGAGSTSSKPGCYWPEYVPAP